MCPATNKPTAIYFNPISVRLIIIVSSIQKVMYDILDYVLQQVQHVAGRVLLKLHMRFNLPRCQQVFLKFRVPARCLLWISKKFGTWELCVIL
jgi:hypothetical protein